MRIDTTGKLSYSNIVATFYPPFRYRSYYFDSDLGLCYLHRYYVAE